MTAAIGRDGSGSFASQTLQIAADRLELLAEQIKLLRGPDVLPADAVRAEMGEGL